MRTSPHLRRIGVVFVGVALSGSLLVQAKAAGTPTPTMIKFSPLPVTYGSVSTLRGVLETLGSTAVPVAGKTIQITLHEADGTSVVLGQPTTGADGAFSVTTTLPRLGMITADFAGDSGFGSFHQSEFPTATLLPTRVTMDAPQAPLAGLSMTTVTGTVQMQTPDGTWVPAPDALVRVAVQGRGTNVHGRTDANGRFSHALWVAAGGPWGLDTDADPYSFVEQTASPELPVQILPAQTSISLNVYPDPADNRVSFTADTNAIGPVDLYFRAANTTNWVDMGSMSLTGMASRFSDNSYRLTLSTRLPNGTLAQGSWQARVLPTAVEQASSSNIQTVDLRTHATFSSVAIRRAGRSRSLQGVLEGTSAAQPLAKQTIKLYFRYRGSKVWHYALATTTASNGTFSLKLTGQYRWYKAVFDSNADYLSTSSASIYFSR